MSKRLTNIDALRGIAAYAVVLYHLMGGFIFFTVNPTLFNFLPAFGYSGVYLFFVISGFCIHLRWVKQKQQGEKSPKINFKEFWKRRWIRLYPAYIATLILFIGYGYFLGILKFNFLFLWDIVSHLLMIHNLDGRTVYSMNGVLWTLAIEEQLYLLYFVLLWMRQKLGWLWTLIICFSLRFVWFGISQFSLKVIGFDLPFAEGALANWWIWALGALSVENYFGIQKLPDWCYSPGLSAISLFCGGFLHFGMVMFNNTTFSRLAVMTEPLFWGLGFFILLNAVMKLEGSIKSWLISACAFVGLFSYSLYLTHEFIIGTWKEVNVLILAPACLCFAYFFFLVFERPFIKVQARKS